MRIDGPYQGVLEDHGVRVENCIRMVRFLNLRVMSIFLKTKFAGFRG